MSQKPRPFMQEMCLSQYNTLLKTLKRLGARRDVLFEDGLKFGSPSFWIQIAPRTLPTPCPESRLALCTCYCHKLPERVAQASAQRRLLSPPGALYQAAGLLLAKAFRHSHVLTPFTSRVPAGAIWLQKLKIGLSHPYSLPSPLAKI